MTLTHSEHIGDLAQALLKAQAHFKPAQRSRTCDDGTRIADVSDIYAATRKALAKQGLVVSQFVGHDAVETILMHAPTGEWLAARTASARDRDGSVSYGPRTALLYALGVVEEGEMPTATAYVDVAYDLASAVGMQDALRVSCAFHDAKLSTAQRLVIAKSGKTADEMIAVAARMGGRS